jgi:hypothetical protein
MRDLKFSERWRFKLISSGFWHQSFRSPCCFYLQFTSPRRRWQLGPLKRRCASILHGVTTHNTSTWKYRFLDFMGVKSFKVGLNTILHRFYPWLCSFQMQLYRCWFFGSPGCVDRRGSYHKHILQKTATHNAYNRQPSFESFHQTMHLPLVHTTIAILSCHSSVNFTSFYTLWPQKWNHISLSFFGEFYQRTTVLVYHIIIAKQKTTGNQIGVSLSVLPT